MKEIMKYDIKSICLGLLIILSVVFFCLWYFSTDDAAKQEVKQLQIENKKLQKERADIEKKNDSIVTHYKIVEENTQKTLDMISDLHVKFVKLEVEVKDSKKEVEATNVEINDLLKQIEYLKANPVKRTGDDLLNSLNKKINDR